MDGWMDGWMEKDHDYDYDHNSLIKNNILITHASFGSVEIPGAYDSQSEKGVMLLL